MAEFLSKTGFDIAWKKLMRYLRRIPDEIDKSRPSIAMHEDNRPPKDGWGPDWSEAGLDWVPGGVYPEYYGLKIYNSVEDQYEGIYIGNPDNMQGGNLRTNDEGVLYFDIASAVNIPEIYANTKPESVTVDAFNKLIVSNRLMQGATYNITYTGPSLNTSAAMGKSIKNAGVTMILVTTATSSNTFERVCRVKSINGANVYGSILADRLTCYCSYGPTVFSSDSFHVDSMEYNATNGIISVSYDFINILWWREVVEVDNFYDDQGNAHVAKLLIGSPGKLTPGKEGCWMNTFNLGAGYNAINLAKNTPTQDAFYKPLIGPMTGNVNIDGYNLVIYSSSVYIDSLSNFRYNKIDKSNGVTNGWTVCSGNMSFDIKVSWSNVSNYILGYHCNVGGNFSDGYGCTNNVIRYSKIQFIGNAFYDNTISHSSLLDFRGGISSSVIENTSARGCKVSIANCNVNSMSKIMSLQGTIDENLLKLGKTLPISDSVFPNDKTNIQNTEMINCHDNISLGSHKIIDCRLEFLGPYTVNNDISREYITGYKINSRQ